MCIVMFKEENIEILSKLFCFIIFILVICFLNNIFSLLLLFVFFFLIGKKEESLTVLMLDGITIIGLAAGFINNNLVLLKVALILDFGYYFIHRVMVNKHSFLVKKDYIKENNENVLVNESDYNVEDKVKEELKKGKLLKEENINLINDHLDEKANEIGEDKKSLKNLRFANFKNISFNYKWNFSLDDINGIYVVCHLLLLILAIVVE